MSKHCSTCARRLDLEKLDYTVGCKHEQMEGFICLTCASEGVAYWMTNTSEDDYCEEYIERTSNAFPTHECVEPTHECVEKQVTGKLINVEIPTKRESEEAEKQVNDELISRQAAIDALRYAQHRFTVADEAGGIGTVKWSEDVIYFAAAENVLADLPSEPVGNSDTLRPKGKWIDMNGPEVFPFWQRYKCSVCGERANMSNYCPRCGSRMRG